MATVNPSIVEVIYRTVRSHDVELAEDLYRRLPTNINTLDELSRCFLNILNVNGCTLGGLVPCSSDIGVWISDFTKHLLPKLINKRLPAYTVTPGRSYYSRDDHLF